MIRGERHVIERATATDHQTAVTRGDSSHMRTNAWQSTGWSCRIHAKMNRKNRTSAGAAAFSGELNTFTDNVRELGEKLGILIELKQTGDEQK